MKTKILPLIAVAMFLAGTHGAQAQTSRVPADLVGLPRCVWGKLKIDARAPLVNATEAQDSAATDRELLALRGATLQSASACAPSINQDQPTGDEVLVSGLRQEAAGDLIARDLKITRAQLDRAITGAPAALTASLRKIANEKANRQTLDPAPSLSSLYTALKLPAGGPASPKQAAWIASYVQGYFDVRANAAAYDPNPKE